MLILTNEPFWLTKFSWPHFHFCFQPPQPQPLSSSAGSKVTLNQFDCSLCSKSFTSRPLLTRHLKNHTTAAAAAATTPIISDGTAAVAVAATTTTTTVILQCETKSNNQVSIVKPIKTELDHSSTASVSESQNNIKSHSTSGAGVTASSRAHNGEKRFQCGQCSKRFPTSKDLKRHDVVHTGNREFQCSFCR